jgi:tetratricopeptide (TPR) repeat protein
MRARVAVRGALSVGALACALAAVLAPARSLAQDAPAESATTQANDREARRIFELGSAAYQERDYEAALEHFEHAYRLSPRPALLFNIGQCNDRLRRDPEAIDAFERYLRAEPVSPYREEAQSRLRILRRAESDRTASAEHGGGSVFGKWWFWTIVGVVVAGAATGIVVVATSGSDANVPGGDFPAGGIVMALGGP